MSKLYIARDIMEAHFVRGLLESHGVQAVVLGELLHNVSGVVPGTADAMPTVYVHADHAEQALEILRHETELASLDAQLLSEQRVEPWECESCGELIDPQFDACWNCDAIEIEDEHV